MRPHVSWCLNYVHTEPLTRTNEISISPWPKALLKVTRRQSQRGKCNHKAYHTGAFPVAAMSGAEECGALCKDFSFNLQLFCRVIG